MLKNVNYSYWEMQQYFTPFDLIVTGGGIVGLNTAIAFKQKNKKARVLVLERGILPNGASTKNAGFACFGSPGELLDDLEKIPEKTVWETVEMRWKGLQLLEKNVGAKNMRLQRLGGYELFDDVNYFNACHEKLPYLNNMAWEVIGLKNTYKAVGPKTKKFNAVSGIFFNRHEGQIDTGEMMKHLTLLALKNDILILNNIHVAKINDVGSHAELLSDAGVFKARKVVVAVNGFARRLLKLKDVMPARAQVLITKPIKNLELKGCFHYEQGYYYFRNIDNRVLLGGGRNLDFKTETTTEQQLNAKIQKRLDQLLKTVILPGLAYEIDRRWTGIMGVGSEKKPIIEAISPNVLAAVRMGGMGIAIGSLVGKIAAQKISGN